MDSIFTVFQAEVMAILRGTELLLPKNIMRRRIHICSDSRAATAALAKTTTKLALVWDSMQALEKLSGSNTVTLVWIPGHHGMPGNEEADKMYMEGTNGVPYDQTAGIPFDVGKAVIRSHLRQGHLNRVQTCKSSHQSKTLITEFLSSRTKELQAMSKPEAYSSCGAVNRLNNPFRAQMFKLGLT